MAEPGEAAAKHRIPVIDRMMDVLTQLERRENGATIRELVTQLRLPRTTIYRILNTLQLHDMVRRDDKGTYQLGRRLLGLAAHVAAGASEADFLAVAQPQIEHLAADLGEGCKLSVLDRDGVLVIAAANGWREYALSVSPGQRQPPHAGAASKLLLAYLPPEGLAHWLDQPHVAYTNRTLTEPRRLKLALSRIRRIGWSDDKGELAPSIHAFAAPVFDPRGQMMAAISVPFLAGQEASRKEEIRQAVIDRARELTAALPGSLVH